MRKIKRKYEPLDFIGKEFGRLIIIGISTNNRNKVLCLCSCGIEKEIELRSLRRGKTKSCGCIQSENVAKRGKERGREEIGNKYGRFVILEEVLKIDKDRRFLCECSCGTRKVVGINALRGGRTKSCGCYKRDKAFKKRVSCVGKKYGKLTIIKEVGIGKRSDRRVLAQCDCDGGIKEYSLQKLRFGHTNSCGCFQIESVKEKMTFRKKDYEEKHPLFCQIEEVTDDPNAPGILVRCKKCNEWFKPTMRELSKRIQAIENPKGFGENNFYCSDECKYSCPVFNLKSDPFATKEINLNQPTNYDLSIWSNQCKLNQLNEHGKNFCEICSKEDGLGSYLAAHHEIPKKLHPFFALDPDNGIILCRECHHKYGHNDECSTGALAYIICNNQENNVANASDN